MKGFYPKEMDGDYLICDTCGQSYGSPFDDGDKCLCGGQSRDVFYYRVDRDRWKELTIKLWKHLETCVDCKMCPHELLDEVRTIEETGDE